MQDDLFSKLLKPRTKANASYKVYATASYYPGGFAKVFVPNTPYEKLSAGFELIKDGNETEKTSQTKTSIEDDLERSLRRTIKTIRDYTLCNRFEHLATFTFSPEKSTRFDIPKVKIQMYDWLKNQQKRKGKFQYLIVPELHESGALHFHALFKGYEGEIRESVDDKKGRKVIIRGRQKYFLPSFTLGFTDVSPIDSKNESHLKVSGYLSKYITKDMLRFAGQKRYWASTGLRLPLTEDNPGDWYLKQTPLKTYKSEYGVTMIFKTDHAPDGWKLKS